MERENDISTNVYAQANQFTKKNCKFALFYYSSMWSLESIQNTPNPSNL